MFKIDDSDLFSAEIARENSRQLLWSLLETQGWTRIVLPSLASSQEYRDRAEWAGTNARRTFHYFKREFIFEDGGDAMWFKLRWL